MKFTISLTLNFLINFLIFILSDSFKLFEALLKKILPESTKVISPFKLIFFWSNSLTSDLKNIVYKDYINIGVAVDTPDGLIVPNIKNSNKKSVKKISDEIFELASLAKQRKLKVDQLKGATFTISSLSGIGGKFFTPIINPPEVGIMGLSKTFKSLRMENGKVTERDTLPMSLSYDHRVINGAYAAKFITALTAKLEDIEFLNSSFGD